jgi:hypothetical protein
MVEERAIQAVESEIARLARRSAALPSTELQCTHLPFSLHRVTLGRYGQVKDIEAVHAGVAATDGRAPPSRARHCGSRTSAWRKLSMSIEHREGSQIHPRRRCGVAVSCRGCVSAYHTRASLLDDSYDSEIAH